MQPERLVLRERVLLVLLVLQGERVQQVLLVHPEVMVQQVLPVHLGVRVQLERQVLQVMGFLQAEIMDRFLQKVAIMTMRLIG